MKNRKEVHTRAFFANVQCEKWLKEITKAVGRGGSAASGRFTMKYTQARRIYIHYTNEFQINSCLPLSK